MGVDVATPKFLRWSSLTDPAILDLPPILPSKNRTLEAALWRLESPSYGWKSRMLILDVHSDSPDIGNHGSSSIDVVDWHRSNHISNGSAEHAAALPQAGVGVAKM